MRNSRLLIAFGLFFGLAQAGHAVCNATQACDLPTANGTAGSWSATASGMTGIQALRNSNDANSRYYFAASYTTTPGTLGKGALSTIGDGTQVVGGFISIGAGTTVTGGGVQQLLGDQSYHFYAQACPAGAARDSGLCSDWGYLGSQSTNNYPTNVFTTPVRPTDTTVDSIAARVNVPSGDQSNISQVLVEVRNLISGGLNQSNIDLLWTGTNNSYPITNAMYTAGGGFLPNVKYAFVGQVYYPYGVAIPPAGETETNLWTRPVNPGAISVSNITHCSAQITALNSSGSPANPAYTTYSLCAFGTGGSCGNDMVSGATAGDVATVTITGLNDGTDYTPRATALVGNGDGTSAGWSNSDTNSGSGFQTLAFGGTFSIGTVTETSAIATVSGVNTTGLTSWEIRLNGVAFASGNAANLNQAHNLTGLTPNTVYTATIVLSEGSTCSSTLNFNPNSFTTTPVAPTGGTFSNTSNASFRFDWTDSSANPNGSVYEAQRCTDAGFTTGCATLTATKPTTNVTFSSLTPSTQYFVRVRTRNVSRPTWPDSAWLDAGSVTTTANPGPVFVNQPSFVGIFRTTATVTTLGNDLVIGEPTLTYTWSLEQGPAPVSFSVNGTNAAKNSVVTFTRTGTYVLRVTIRNANGDNFALTNQGVLNKQLSAITVTPTGITINVSDNQVFTAHGHDQFDESMDPGAVLWTTDPGSNISGAGSFQGAQGNNIRVTATQNGISGHAFVNVVDFDVSGAKAYPVPFKANVSSVITFSGLGTSAKIRIYTTTGRLVFNTEVTSATYDWPVRNNSGESIASGVYLYVIESPQTTKNGKLIIIK